MQGRGLMERYIYCIQTHTHTRLGVHTHTHTHTHSLINYVLCLCIHMQLCGVAIMRAGEVLEPALMSVSKDATLGKILIQTNETTGEPEVFTS